MCRHIARAIQIYSSQYLLPISIFLVRMVPALMMVAMASVIFLIILGPRIALLAVRAAIIVRGGRRAGTSLTGASLE